MGGRGRVLAGGLRALHPLPPLPGRPQGAELHPCELGRLNGLLRRADALGYEHTALCSEEWENAEIQEQALEIVENMRKESTEHFERYRFEVCIPDPTR